MEDKRHRIVVKLNADKEALVKVLTQNGYTVRIITDKVDGKKATCVEYWREEE